jgi:thioredoxin 1
MSDLAAVGTDNFESEVLQADGTVVVDFWAQWCGPCLALTPVLEKVAGEFNGQLKVVKCNVDDNREIASKYGVRGIPNLIFFRNGQVIAQAVGLMDAATLSAKVSAALAA